MQIKGSEGAQLAANFLNNEERITEGKLSFQFAKDQRRCEHMNYVTRPGRMQIPC